MERSFRTVFASAQSVPLTTTELASPSQLAKLVSHGTERSALEFLVFQELHTLDHATVVKPPFTPAPPEPIGTVTDAFTSQTSVPPAWFGKTTAARATRQNAQVIHTNSTELVFPFHHDAHPALPGTPPTVAPPLQTPARPAHTTTESSVFHTCHATTERSGTTLCHNACAHKEVSPTEFHVSDVPLDSFMPTVDVTAQTDFSSTESNALLRLSTNVSPFQTPTGTELTASASQDSALPETHAIVMVSSWVTIVKDVLPSQTQSGEAESVNVTLDMPMSMVLVLSRQLSAFHAMLPLISIHNSKNVCHALMDV